ncbi:hypothetical protein ABEB36_014650 [Hypothenemus hampei]|uniref:Uncharacterized protein n=1 Tax=Hypothenemus hampei TaxID=57062 RepID=A0ABD1E2P5_HYPHA
MEISFSESESDSEILARPESDSSSESSLFESRLMERRSNDTSLTRRLQGVPDGDLAETL